MKTEMFLVICFLVGVLIFYLLKQSCGCSAVVEGNAPPPCEESINIITNTDGMECSSMGSEAECQGTGVVGDDGNTVTLCGYSGGSCALTGGQCLRCGEHGTYSDSTGVCDCTDGYTGVICETPPTGCCTR